VHADGTSLSRSFDRELEHELCSSHPRIKAFYMDVGCDSSSPAEWSPARRSPTKRSLEVETCGSPREFFDGATTAGRAVTRTHVPTGKISGEEGRGGEIRRIRFMLEFRTPASASG
jgi:hypothetical protein